MGRFVRVALIACGFLAIGGTVAWATGLASFGFVGSDGSITACVSNANGNVRLVDPSATTCKSSESTVRWGPSAAIVSGGYGPPVPVTVAGSDADDPHSTAPIAHIDLPAGNFAVTAKAEFSNPSGATVVIGCFLGPVDQGKITIPPGGVAIMPFAGAYESDGRSGIDLQCLSYGGAARLNHIPRSVAIQVGNITQN